MRKIKAVLLASALIFSLTGCSLGSDSIGGERDNLDDVEIITEKVDGSHEKNDSSSDVKVDEETSVSDKDVKDEKNDAKSDDISDYGDSDEQIETVLNNMTLHEKVCQMIFINPESIVNVSTVVAAGDATKAALEKYPIGGIMYSKPNLESRDQVSEMITNVQGYSPVDVFIAADEEGGVVNRLMATLNTTYVDSMFTYKDQGNDTAFNNAFTIAKDMRSLGFNLDFAPVADVWSNPSNTVIGKRAYSDDYNQAAELLGYAVNGFHEGGVLCTLKHFPGHGDTAEDSHYSSAYVSKSRADIEAHELLPFKAGIDAGADFVMIGHLIVKDISEEPALFSKTIVTEMLRENLGFEGVIITDSLEMAAVSGKYSVKDIVIKAVDAGCDMLLEPTNVPEAVSALEEAVENGTISEERINASVRRILKAKAKHGMSIADN